MVPSICLTVFLLVLVSCLEDGVECTPTGVWIDDGTGQTVKAELPPWDAKVLRKNVLDLLGLPEPHYRRHHHHHGSDNGSATNYMTNLFSEIDERGQAPRLDPQHRVAVDAADAIITFASIVKQGTPSKHLEFNLNDVPLEMVLLGAELRIHRSGPSNEVVSKEDDDDLYLRAILISHDKSEEVIAKSLLKSDGWIGFNATSTFLQWVIDPPSNQGVRLSVRRANSKHEMHLYQGGITGSHGEVNFRPFLVGYFSKGDDDERHEVNKIRKVREARPPVSDLKFPYGMPFIKTVHTSSRDNNQCQKLGLHVSFKDLGWQDWVIAPDGYDADYCDGKCQFPMLAHTNATNHAIIQTLVKLKHAVSDPDELPPDACCAPKDLANIQVLFYDYSNNVVLKKYQKMIVKTCGCI